jgi:hypothetical protein
MDTGSEKKPVSRDSNFEDISQDDLPSGRRGKHHPLLVQVLEDLKELPPGRAMKIPLAEFTGNVADRRSAISRATSKLGIEIATSSDDEFLYVWKPAAGSGIRE